jgi:CheY-like chemotaxis protein
MVILAAALILALAALVWQRAAARARQDARDREAAARSKASADRQAETQQQLAQAQTRISAQDAAHAQLLEDFRQAQRLEAVGRLVGGVAHDFNNQLTSIIGYAELLLWDLKDEDPKRSDLLEVRRAADRANIITQQLLAFTRSQPRQQAAVSLADSLLGAIRLLRRVLGPDIQFTTQLEREPTIVHADAVLLGHALLNLGVRARDLLPAGGTMAFEVGHVSIGPADAAPLQLPGPGFYAMLTMRMAAGPGTPAMTNPRPGPAAATREALAADARAMTVTHQIMTLGGGAFAVRGGGKGDVGDTMLLYLPRVMSVEEAPPPSAPRGTETVLIVDDEPVVRDLTRTLLERHGYRVITADRPSEALTRVRALPTSIDLLVTDLLLPEQRGDMMAAGLAAAGFGSRVLYMSGNDATLPDDDGPLEPAGAFLLKPFTPDQLLIAVRQAIDAPPPPA